MDQLACHCVRIPGFHAEPYGPQTRASIIFVSVHFSIAPSAMWRVQGLPQHELHGGQIGADTPFTHM